ncbi:hypothetical protein VP01_6140g1, partial [Puccinia sorghi]
LVMDEINPTILKTTIEAIPILTEDNFSIWKPSDNMILCAIIMAKHSATTHNNVVTSTNEDDTIALWKTILKRFISTEPSNCACVYSQFANISFNTSNIEKFITEVRSTLVKMEDAGINMEKDIITYDLLSHLLSSLDNINQSITHSRNGEDIKPEALLDHLPE